MVKTLPLNQAVVQAMASTQEPSLANPLMDFLKSF